MKITFTIITVLLFASPAVLHSFDKPNIVFILADDVGLGDVHCTGGPFKTPNIDTLAAGGTRFESCYAAPLCGPSRCQLLSGLYPFRTGMNMNRCFGDLKPGQPTLIPTVLKQAGYATAAVGKWWQFMQSPDQWGFDEHLIFPNDGVYWREQINYYTVNGKRHDLPADVYLPDVLHSFAVDFIQRNKERPFFLYYPLSHIHTVRGGTTLTRTPHSPPDAGKDQIYADNIQYMDKLVGQLVAELDRQRLREKTLVIFAGDNGTAGIGVHLATVNGRPISGQKGCLFEGGSRVPLVINWPGSTPAGKVNGDLVDFSDFFVTFAELAGAKLPEGVAIDGRSFAPQIRGEKGTPRQWVYVELNGKSYARESRFKLTSEGDLFDLSDAPFQEIPVAKNTTDAAAIAARMMLQTVLEQHPAGLPRDKNGMIVHDQEKALGGNPLRLPRKPVVLPPGKNK